MIDSVFFGLGLDCHSLEKGTGITIGGYKIKCNLKSVAHSDGDVLTHAIIAVSYTHLTLPTKA